MNNEAAKSKRERARSQAKGGESLPLGGQQQLLATSDAPHLAERCVERQRWVVLQAVVATKHQLTRV